MSMRRGFVLVAVVAVLSGTACSGIRASSARQSHIQDQLKVYVFPTSCEALWVDALKVIAGHEFKMVGPDRELVGQPSHGSIARFLSRGHASTRDDRGVFEAVSDSDNANVRYMVRATPEGPNGCRVEFTGIQEDKANSSDSYWRDYDFEIELVARVSPADGARILIGADEAAEKAAK